MVACTTPLGSSVPHKKNGMGCGVSPELIVDPSFSSIKEFGSQWQYRQHMSDQSFTIEAEDEVITFERIGSEPWAVFAQTITDERLSGATIRYNADLRGDVSPDVSHFLAQKRGFFCNLERTLMPSWEIKTPVMDSGIGKLIASQRPCL
jgi:hypothetical protein